MSWLRPNRVLVPTDFSDAARRAVAEAAETIHDVSEIHVLHVVPVIDPDQPGIVWGEDPAQVDLESARHRLLAWLAESNLEGVKAHVTTGAPAEEIVSVAETLSVDLIVILARAHGPVAAALGIGGRSGGPHGHLPGPAGAQPAD